MTTANRFFILRITKDPAKRGASTKAEGSYSTEFAAADAAERIWRELDHNLNTLLIIDDDNDHIVKRYETL